jgi:hypothetical protein
MSVTFDADLEPRPLPSAGVTRPRRYYGPLRHPKRPSLSLAGVWLRVTRPHRMGFPCCVRSPFTDMPSSIPRWPAGSRSLVGRPIPTVSLFPAAAAFPKQGLGRRPHWTFRGLLNVHWLLRPVSSLHRLKRHTCLEGSDGFVSSTAAPIATGWSDPVAGQDFHLLTIVSHTTLLVTSIIGPLTQPQCRFGGPMSLFSAPTVISVYSLVLLLLLTPSRSEFRDAWAGRFRPRCLRPRGVVSSGGRL